MRRAVISLEDTSLAHLGYKALTEEEVCGRGAKAVPFAQLAPAALLDYAGERADLARQLSNRLAPLLVGRRARVRLSRAGNAA